MTPHNDQPDQANPTDQQDPHRAAALTSIWVRWCYSTRDRQVHAFPIEDSQYGRWPQAVCTHTAPPAAIHSTTTRLLTRVCRLCAHRSATR